MDIELPDYAEAHREAAWLAAQIGGAVNASPNSPLVARLYSALLPDVVADLRTDSDDDVAL